MKQLLLAFVFVSRVVELNAQQPQVVSLLEHERVWVYSKTNLANSFNNRTVLPLYLPPNCVGVVYQISTQPQEASPLIKSPLVSTIASAIPNGTAVLSVAKLAYAATEAVGEGKVDIMLFRESVHADSFVNHEEGTYLPIRSGSRKGFVSGAVGFETRKEAGSRTLYLGLQNPEVSRGVLVTVDAVAVVQANGNGTGNAYAVEGLEHRSLSEKVDDWRPPYQSVNTSSLVVSSDLTNPTASTTAPLTVWPEEGKTQLADLFYTNLTNMISAHKRARVGDDKLRLLADCLMAKYVAAFNPEEAQSLSQAVQDAFFKKAVVKCNETLELGLENAR